MPHRGINASSPQFWVSLRGLRISSPKLKIFSTTETIGSQQFVSSLHTSPISKPMYKFLHKTILVEICNVRIISPTSYLGFVGNQEFFAQRLFSSSSNQHSFTVFYLTNELGLSSKAALSVSKRVNFDTPEKPEKVINLFKKYGFSQSQISSLLRRNVQLFLADTEKSILPKLEFFDAKGVSWPQFAKRLSQFPTILGSSLDKQIMPSYEFLRNFLQSDEMAIAAVERYPGILSVNVGKCFGCNIDILRQHGVPNSNIAKLILTQSRAFSVSSNRFQKIVEEVVEMGFDVKSTNFVKAVLVLCGLSKSTWEKKISAYEKWGWSKEVVLKAFERHPGCMSLSVDKITAGMTFFINEMGLRPCLIAKDPVILSLSLKKRVIPRFSVFQALLSKGLVKKGVKLLPLVKIPETKFLQKFVMPHEKEASELLKLYEEKLNPSNKLEIDDKVCRIVS